MTMVLLNRAGSLVGGAGILVCLASALTRATGNHYLLGFELATVLLAGVALISAGCLAKLQVLVSRQS